MSQDGSSGGDGSRPSDKRVELVVITGYSGAGKSEAIAAFEDGGYFCVDNLPPRMIEGLGELFQHEGSGVEKAAVVTDVRGGEYFEDLLAVLGELKSSARLDLKVVFLEADDEALLHRYRETRRRHPLSIAETLRSGLIAPSDVVALARWAAPALLSPARLQRRAADGHDQPVRQGWDRAGLRGPLRAEVVEPGRTLRRIEPLSLERIPVAPPTPVP